MEKLFLSLLNMSLTAGWMILAVLLLRCVFRRAPKAVILALWLLVGLRLVLPFSLESAVSLVPSARPVPQTIVLAQRPAIDSGISAVDQAVNPILAENLAPAVGDSVNPLQVWTAVAAWVWAAGVAGLAIYALASYLRLRRRVAASLPVEQGVYICDDIDTPFLLGLFRPRIYLPSRLEWEARACILAHEQAHKRNGDHWIKPLAYCLLALHWINPLVWVAYVLLCRDLELFCDERVIRGMDEAARKTYSRVLLDCSAPRRAITACPVAFGETAVKARIQAVMHYKRPGFWIILAAILAGIAAAVLLMTNPVTSTTLTPGQDAAIARTVIAKEHPKGRTGLVCCEDHEVLGVRIRGKQVTVYAMVLSENFEMDTGEKASGSHVPTAFTLEEQGNDVWQVTEYWTAEDGSRYLPSIRAKFPRSLWSKAADTQRTITAQQARITQKRQEPPEDGSVQNLMMARVLEVGADQRTLLVEPIYGSWELFSADRISLTLPEGAPAAQAYESVEVLYHGLLETYPAQLQTVYQVTPRTVEAGAGVTVGSLVIPVPEGMTVTPRVDGFDAKLARGEAVDGAIQVIMSNRTEPLEMTGREYADFVSKDGETLTQNWLSGQRVRPDMALEVLADEQVTVAGLPAVHARCRLVREDGATTLDWVSLLDQGVIYEITTLWQDTATPDMVANMERAVAGISRVGE